MDIAVLYKEVQGYVDAVVVEEDGEHLWSKYEEVTAILIRLTQIRNELAYLEILGRATTEAKKFRTTILDPTIDRFEKIAQYESRKITAKSIESSLER